MSRPVPSAQVELDANVVQLSTRASGGVRRSRPASPTPASATPAPVSAAAPAPASAVASTRPVLSVAEVAELLGVSEWLVLQQVHRGLLPHRRVGRRIVFSRQLLLAWLEAPDTAAVNDRLRDHAHDRVHGRR